MSRKELLFPLFEFMFILLWNLVHIYSISSIKVKNNNKCKKLRKRKKEI